MKHLWLKLRLKQLRNIRQKLNKKNLKRKLSDKDWLRRLKNLLKRIWKLKPKLRKPLLWLLRFKKRQQKVIKKNLRGKPKNGYRRKNNLKKKSWQLRRPRTKLIKQLKMNKLKKKLLNKKPRREKLLIKKNF